MNTQLRLSWLNRRSLSVWLTVLRLWLGFSVAFWAFWWGLTEGAPDAYGWGGMVSLVLGLGLSVQSAKAGWTQVVWRHLPGLVVFLMFESFKGGWDVALRALARHPKTRDYCFEYPLQLTTPWACDLWTLLVGLMPGTVAVRVTATGVEVQVLDQAMAVHASLAQLERHLQKLEGTR